MIIYICTGKKPNRKLSYNSYASIQNYMHENSKSDSPKKPTKEEVDELIEILKAYKNC